MKIGIAYLEYSRRKGIERISAELADRVAERGHEVHFHCRMWQDTRGSRVQFHRVHTFDLVNSSKLFSFAVLGKSGLSRGNYTVTHSYGGVIGCDVITAQSCHRAGLKIAEALKGKTISTNVNYGIADRIRLYLEHQNFAKRKYRKVIACSTLVKRELMENYKVPDSDIAVVPNGVDLEEFHPRNRGAFLNDLRSQYHIGNQEILLLFVGHEFGRKGLEAVIRAVALLRRQHIKLLVCGNDNVLPFQKLVSELGVHQQIIFAGAQAEVKRCYAAADIFVLPTLHEAFGLVITEAMASALPVIVSKDAGAAIDVIDDGKDGLLLSEPQNPEEVARKIQQLAEDSPLRTKVGMQAREKVAGYSWDSCTQKVLKVYEEVRHSKSL
jgi:UDP-glucose:(heptosyl)LPS alpha-1,3-glucosyltransferase